MSIVPAKKAIWNDNRCYSVNLTYNDLVCDDGEVTIDMNQVYNALIAARFIRMNNLVVTSKAICTNLIDQGFYEIEIGSGILIRILAYDYDYHPEHPNSNYIENKFHSYWRADGSKLIRLAKSERRVAHNAPFYLSIEMRDNSVQYGRKKFLDKLRTFAYLTTAGLVYAGSHTDM